VKKKHKEMEAELAVCSEGREETQERTDILTR
jgi:hypothetical protein